MTHVKKFLIGLSIIIAALTVYIAKNIEPARPADVIDGCLQKSIQEHPNYTLDHDLEICKNEE